MTVLLLSTSIRQSAGGCRLPLGKLRDEHHRLILWTVREGRLLDEALAFCRDRGLEFYAVNRDYPEEEKGRNNHYSRKLKADLFIDDRNLGGLPDWGTIYGMIHDGTTFSDLIRSAGESPVSENHGRGLSRACLADD